MAVFDPAVFDAAVFDVGSIAPVATLRAPPFADLEMSAPGADVLFDAMLTSARRPAPAPRRPPPPCLCDIAPIELVAEVADLPSADVEIPAPFVATIAIEDS